LGLLKDIFFDVIGQIYLYFFVGDNISNLIADKRQGIDVLLPLLLAVA
jgi:hypothetical protein